MRSSGSRGSGSGLACTQTIRNVSTERDNFGTCRSNLCRHGRIAVVNLPHLRRSASFPGLRAVCTRAGALNHPVPAGRPQDARRRGEAFSDRRRASSVFTTPAGWFHQMPRSALRETLYDLSGTDVYNEVAGLTISIWCPRRSRSPPSSSEPVGPRGSPAGGSASLPNIESRAAFPASGAQLDLQALASRCMKQPEPAGGSGLASSATGSSIPW